LSHTSSPFAFVIFGIGFCFLYPGQSGPLSSYFKLPAVAGMTNTHHQTKVFSIQMRLQNFFLSGLTWKCDPPYLSLKELGITGVLSF
jgi:hypothetical protein